MLNGTELLAQEEISDNLESMIHVYYNGFEISRVNAGGIYSEPNIWRLWTYENHWIME